MTYTTQQKKDYYKKLRAEWVMIKMKADDDSIAKGLFKKLGLKTSYYGFYYVYQQMQRLGLTGYPYIDCKTFGGWKESGFKVSKGEKSKITGITWLEIKDKEANEDDEAEFLLPKLYHLFHKSQVEKR